MVKWFLATSWVFVLEKNSFSSDPGSSRPETKGGQVISKTRAEVEEKLPVQEGSCARSHIRNSSLLRAGTLPRAEAEEKSPSRSGPVRGANDFCRFDADVLFRRGWSDR